jgi:hypothetical protein
MILPVGGPGQGFAELGSVVAHEDDRRTLGHKT